MIQLTEVLKCIFISHRMDIEHYFGCYITAHINGTINYFLMPKSAGMKVIVEVLSRSAFSYAIEWILSLSLVAI